MIVYLSTNLYLADSGIDRTVFLQYTEPCYVRAEKFPSRFA